MREFYFVKFGSVGAFVEQMRNAEVRDDSDEVPPVPMPNTEVKLIYAENTCLATGWEDK